tara:strand:- start:843 stop:1268 length:426 start_codon:yes stop_codon:yes gene_type:complete
MTNYDATNKNISNRVTKTYRDIDLNFGRNTVTNDVNTLTDADAVKKAVVNLIQTNHYERPFHPEIGSDLRNMMFENMTPLTAMGLKKKIVEVIARYEPRVTITQVIVEPTVETNSYLCEIDFLILGIETPQKVRTSLDRAQ